MNHLRCSAILLALNGLFLVGCDDKKATQSSPQTAAPSAGQAAPSSTVAGPSAGSPAAANATPSPQPSGPADLTVTADDLVKDFEKDVKIATAKYVGKSVQVAGSVSGVAEFNVDHQYIFTLNGSPAIRCIASPAGRQGAKALSIGQDATIRGKCAEVQTDKVIFSDCSVVKSGEDPSIKVSATDLAKAFATKTKIGDYSGSQIQIDGVVQAVKANDSQLILDGFTDAAGVAIAIKCMVGESGVDDIKKLTKGSKVVVKGSCGSSVSDNLISINYAVVQN